MKSTIEKYKEEKLYNYIVSLQNNDLKAIANIISDEALIEFVNTSETLDKLSYIDFLNDKMVNGNFEKYSVERLTPYNDNNVILIYTIKGFKVVSLIDLLNDKIIKIDEYWFKIFE